MFSSNSSFMQCLPIRYLNQSLVIERNSLFHTITHRDCHNPSIESPSLFVHLRAKNRFTEFQGWNPHRNIKRVTDFHRPTTFGRKYRTLLVTKEIFYSTATTAQSISQRPMTSARGVRDPSDYQRHYCPNEAYFSSIDGQSVYSRGRRRRRFHSVRMESVNVRKPESEYIRPCATPTNNHIQESINEQRRRVTRWFILDSMLGEWSRTHRNWALSDL